MSLMITFYSYVAEYERFELSVIIFAQAIMFLRIEKWREKSSMEEKNERHLTFLLIRNTKNVTSSQWLILHHPPKIINVFKSDFN